MGMNNVRKLSIGLLLATTLGLSGCLGMPDGIKPVSDFEVDRYLGKWYEIARLDHSFERGMSNVTAQYSLREDGGVEVLNRGFLIKDNAWDDAKGKAFFVGEKDTGYLKVSFFGPFYGSYVIFELDQVDYQYSFVSGPDTSYLWLLSRTPKVSDDVMQKFMQRAGAFGFDVDSLIYVEHDKADG